MGGYVSRQAIDSRAASPGGVSGSIGGGANPYGLGQVPADVIGDGQPTEVGERVESLGGKAEVLGGFVAYLAM